MGDKSRIAWTDATWNPVTGCSKVSPACDHCYAEKTARKLRLQGHDNYRNEFDVTCHPHMLNVPRRWRKPRRVFVCSMSDLFHPEVPFDFVTEIYSQMSLATQHTFQVLTKRPRRMAEYIGQGGWSFDNIYHGVTIEDCKRLERIEPLLRMPVGVKYISFEPLLEDVTIDYNDDPQSRWWWSHIDWVIIGGESGEDARPMEESWVRRLITVARKAECKVFVKQMGTVWARKNKSRSFKGEIMEEWPEDLQIQEVPWRPQVVQTELF